MQLAGAGHHDTAHVRRQDARDGQGVAGGLQSHLVVGRQAGGEQLELLWGRRYTAGRAYVTALADCHLAEVAVDVDAELAWALSFP